MTELLTTSNVDETWHAALSALRGGLRTRFVASRAGATTEVLAASLHISAGENTFLANERRAASAQYAAAELLWYLSGTANTHMIRQYAPQYANFTESDGTAHGAYGARWRMSAADNQLERALKELRTSPESRRAVVTAWDESRDLGTNAKDIPCTLSIQFILRDMTLHAVATMRSNDVWLGTPYDMFCFTAIQRLLADSLGADVGHYYHNVGSLHLYNKNAVAALEAWRQIDFASPHEWAKTALPLDVARKTAVNIERTLRESSSQRAKLTPGEIVSCLGGGTLLADCALCCATKWVKQPVAYVESVSHPVMKRSLRCLLSKGQT